LDLAKDVGSSNSSYPYVSPKLLGMKLAKHIYIGSAHNGAQGC
jgi:hypothetical protein